MKTDSTARADKCARERFSSRYKFLNVISHAPSGLSDTFYSTLSTVLPKCYKGLNCCRDGCQSNRFFFYLCTALFKTANLVIPYQEELTDRAYKCAKQWFTNLAINRDSSLHLQCQTQAQRKRCTRNSIYLKNCASKMGIRIFSF